MDDKVLGQAGELAACDYLACQKQMQILTRNYRSRTGEIDIIARDNDTLVFIEVKTRQSCRHGQPCEAVSRRKQQKIIHAAMSYLSRHNIWDFPCRFDVIEVMPSASGQFHIHHIRHAFSLSP